MQSQRSDTAKIKRALMNTDVKPEYILSYLSLSHLGHSLLAVSKLSDGEYYIINTTGMRYADGNVISSQEKIHPKLNVAYAYTKHYAVSVETANRMLADIKNNNGKKYQYSLLSKNCHNYVLALLNDAGINDNCLTKRLVPPSSYPLASFVADELTRVAVPDNLKSEGCRYYLSNRYENFSSESEYCTWKWNDNIKIKQTVSYVRDTQCDNMIKSITDDTESVKLKQALHLLQDYAEGSIFWHPCRTYRSLVSNIIKMYNYGQIKDVNDLLIELKKAVKLYHEENGDVPNINGCLHKKIRYIEFVLNERDSALANTEIAKIRFD